MSRFGILVLLFCFVCFQYGISQNTPPTINAVGDQYYCPLSQIPIITSFDIVDPDDTEIESFNIQISTGYINGVDRLSLIGSHPNIVASWNAGTGKLRLTGVGGAEMDYTDLIAAVSDVVYESLQATTTGEKFFSFTIGDANYLPSTGHYYEYVASSGISWSDARTAAANRTYFGLQGYLATILSSDEAQLSGEQAGGVGWLGGSDQETEGVWKWITGPEAGTIFWNGGTNGTTPNYANWNNNEPNNLGNEDYIHVTFGVGRPGSWNDLPNIGGVNDYFPQGYIVEYGGMPGDPDVDISASTKITIPSIIAIADATRCGAGSLTLEAEASIGTVVWYDTPTGGLSIGTGNTFNTPNINSTTTYYVMASYNGCAEGLRRPVVATINQIPNITTTTDATICDNGSAILRATASSGTISWYDALVGGNLVSTGNAFTTPIVTNTTTYYVDATLNGCKTATRSAVTVTVQKTAAPIGNILQTFCDIENASVSNLTAAGTDVLWYDVATGGTPLNLSEVLTSKTYYATQTELACESNTRLAVDVIIYNTVIPPLSANIPTLQVCDTNADGNDTNGFTEFDLTLNEAIVLNGSSASDFQVNYFTDAAYTNQIPNPSAFVNTVQDGQTIYVRINNNLDADCDIDTSFSIQVDTLPVVQPSVIFKNCDVDDAPEDGFTDFNLNEVNVVITNGNSANLVFTYYLDPADANSGNNAIIAAPFNNETANTVFVRVENGNGCYRISTVNLQVSTTSLDADDMQELETCDDDATIDGLHEFDLTVASQGFKNKFPQGQNLTVHYYRNLDDALLENNEITNQTNYVSEVPFSQTLYVRVESEDNGDCFGIGPYLTLTVHPRPEFEVEQSEVYCFDNAPITLSTFNPQGTYTYEWTDGNGDVVGNLSTITLSEPGTYTVIATSTEGCESFPVVFPVVESAIATITLDDVTIVELSDNNSITIATDNLGIGDYEFALDDISGPYQDEPVFNNVGAGLHTIYVQDKTGCGIANLEVFVLGFPKYFTPNDDGHNDTWNIKGLSDAFTQDSKILIFDRYGKLIKEINPRSEGWNGTFNGQNLIASDYWFMVDLFDNEGNKKTYRGHFSLVR